MDRVLDPGRQLILRRATAFVAVLTWSGCTGALLSSPTPRHLTSCPPDYVLDSESGPFGSCVPIAVAIAEAQPIATPVPTPKPTPDLTKQDRDRFWSAVKAGDELAILGTLPFQYGPGPDGPLRITLADDSTGEAHLYELYAVYVDEAHVTHWQSRAKLQSSPVEPARMILRAPAGIIAKQKRRPPHRAIAKVEIMGFSCDDPPFKICPTPDRLGAGLVAGGYPSMAILLRVVEMSDVP